MNRQCRAYIQFLTLLAVIGLSFGFNNERISKSHLDLESSETAENSRHLHSRRHNVKNGRETYQRHLRKRRDWPNNFGLSGWNQINQSPSPYGEKNRYNFNGASIPYENQRFPNPSGPQVNNFFLPQSSPNPQSFYPNFGIPYPFFGSPYIFVPILFCPQSPIQPDNAGNAGSTGTGVIEGIDNRLKPDEDSQQPSIMVNPNDYYNSDTGISLEPIKPLRPPSEPVPSVNRVVGVQSQRPSPPILTQPPQTFTPRPSSKRFTTTEAPEVSINDCITEVMGCCNNDDESSCIRNLNCFFFDDPCDAIRKSLQSTLVGYQK